MATPSSSPLTKLPRLVTEATSKVSMKESFLPKQRLWGRMPFCTKYGTTTLWCKVSSLPSPRTLMVKHIEPGRPKALILSLKCLSLHHTTAKEKLQRKCSMQSSVKPLSQIILEWRICARPTLLQKRLGRLKNALSIWSPPSFCNTNRNDCTVWTLKELYQTFVHNKNFVTLIILMAVPSISTIIT